MPLLDTTHSVIGKQEMLLPFQQIIIGQFAHKLHYLVEAILMSLLLVLIGSMQVLFLVDCLE